ncbi:hypothetical protein ABZ863_11110 [Saccharomonospora sp. NPDC046836]
MTLAPSQKLVMLWATILFPGATDSASRGYAVHQVAQATCT